jgi:putative flippase GtrA
MPAPSEGSGSSSPPVTASSEESPAGSRPGLIGRLLRAGATSIMATVLSHGVYVGLLAVARADATLASTVSFFCGAIFNYLVGRRVTWCRRNRPHPLKEMLPYVVVIASSGALSIAVATLTQHLIQPMDLTVAQRTVVLEIANILSYGVVFFFKFTLLDRLVFRRD